MQNSECGMQNEEAEKPVGYSSLYSAFCIPNSAFKIHRLTGKLRFSAVYDAKVKASRGPLVMYSLPNLHGHPRMGISMSRHVGIAPKRNRIKRLLRESFRLHRYQFPVGYDLVIVVRPHAPMELGEYRASIAHLLKQAHMKWQERRTQLDTPAPPSSPA